MIYCVMRHIAARHAQVDQLYAARRRPRRSFIIRAAEVQALIVFALSSPPLRRLEIPIT